MPDPTPTPDTLRAAVERLCADLDDEAGNYLAAEPIHFRGLAEATRAHAAQLRAALAASPAPTDSPTRLGICTYDAAPHAMFDDCADWRPAAVAAPREDERPVQPFTVGDGWDGSFDAEGALTLSFSSDVGPQGEYVLDQPEVEHLRGFLAAAAPAVERAEDEALYEYLEVRLRAPAQEYPTTMHLARALLADPRLPWAVERATPDPDTLAALLRECGLQGEPGWSLHVVARALIAAGVTLNQTTT